MSRIEPARRARRILGGLLGAVALALLPRAPLSAAEVEAAERFRVYTDRPGVYALGFEELAAAGLAADGVVSSGLALTNRGRPVPIWLEDGGDGRFGPGDRLEFVAERLPGTESHYHEYSPFNVYWLSVAAGGGARMLAPAPASEAAPSAEPPSAEPPSPVPPSTVSEAAGWRRRVHLEQDRLLIRLGAADLGDSVEPELWFWHKLTHIDRERFEVPVALPGLAGGRDAAVSLALHFRALSSQPDEKPGAPVDEERGASAGQERGAPASQERGASASQEHGASASQERGALAGGKRNTLPDHQVDLSLTSRRLDAITWDGKTPHLARLAPVPARFFERGAQSLYLAVPRRKPEGAGDPLVDVVMLNWIELDYPHDGSVGGEQVELRPAGAFSLASELSVSGDHLVAYGASGTRLPLPGPSAGPRTIGGAPEPSYWLVPEDGLYSVAKVERDRPSSLREAAHQADYLILAHASLLDEARRLADFHRGRGLAVELVDVQDVYDEFGHGIVHPRAVKDFVTWAWQRWAPPAPRYVLLVGDASWDTKNAEADDARYANWVDQQLLAPGGFRAKEIPTYGDGAAPGERNLIPTWNFHTNEGHAASDNWFVAVEGDDLLPELAIGRLPVFTPEELAGVIDKTIRYAATPPVGPWRRRVLWITNEWEWLQDRTAETDEAIRPTGLAGRRIFPSSEEETNEHHQAQLTEAFNEGQLFVHFAGHGGRFIWRTAPRDLGSKNHDLFTLEHVEALAPNDRLPVVFSVTCHSGPFDHPNADSIAEKFLRLPDRGAIAVISAAWRTSAASVWLSRAMMVEFAKGGTIGDAFLRAKRSLDNDDLIATYNLFGDPAVPLALPAGKVELRLEGEGEARRLVGTVEDAALRGEAIVDVLDAEGEVLVSERFSVESGGWEAELPVRDGESWVRAYLWSEEEGIDALGAFDLRPPEP